VFVLLHSFMDGWVNSETPAMIRSAFVISQHKHWLRLWC